MDKDIAADKALIEELGGTTKLAGQLGVSAQVVSNWKARGIPPGIKLKWPHLFLPANHAARTNRRSKARTPSLPA